MKFRKQRGYVLLVLMALVLSAGAGVFVTGISKSVVERKTERDSNTVAQLKNIRQRLLTYAAILPDLYEDNTIGPGYLPCPTTEDDAEAIGGCYHETIVSGWLPRQIVGQNISFEAEGLEWDRVWYVLDARYAFRTNAAGCGGAPLSDSSGRCRPLNTSISPDRITLNGRDDIVALIIYAGSAIGGQSRSAAKPEADIKDYLDGENNDGDAEFISRSTDPDTGQFNDVVVPIYKAEWQRVIRNRVIVSAEADDLCGAGSVTWFSENEWKTGQGVCK